MKTKTMNTITIELALYCKFQEIILSTQHKPSEFIILLNCIHAKDQLII